MEQALRGYEAEDARLEARGESLAPLPAPLCSLAAQALQVIRLLSPRPTAELGGGCPNRPCCSSNAPPPALGGQAAGAGPQPDVCGRDAAAPGRPCRGRPVQAPNGRGAAQRGVVQSYGTWSAGRLR